MKQLRLLFLATLVLGIVVLFPQQSAQAAGKQPDVHAQSVSPASVGCFGYGCYGLDPYTQGCASTVTSVVNITVKDYDGTVLATGRNAYSYQCAANWGEGTLTSAGQNIQIRAYTADELQYECFPEVTSTVCGYYNGVNGWPAYTYMVDGNRTVYVCIRAQSKITFYRQIVCVSQ